MLRKALVLLVVIVALGLSACQSDEEPTAVAGRIPVTPIPRITVCHFTDTSILPYAEITISRDAADRHASHAWDIIPAPLEGCPVPTDESGVEGMQGPASEAATSEPGSTAQPGQAAQPSPTARPAQATCASGEKSVADIVREDERLSWLEEAVEQAGLERLLEEFGPLTLFAPTDQAMDALPDRMLEDWTSDDGRLNALLLYHLVEGEYSTAALADLSSLETISGELIRIRVDGGEILLNDHAELVEADVEACNGVVHLVEDVLLPPILEQEAEPTPTPEDNDDDDDDDGGIFDGLFGGGDGSDNGNGNNGGGTGGSAPQPTNTPVPAPTRTPVPQPTDAPAPTDNSTPTDEPAPTDAPTSEPAPTQESTAVPTSSGGGGG